MSGILSDIIRQNAVSCRGDTQLHTQKGQKWWLIPIGLIGFLLIGMSVYVLGYYRADGTVVSELKSDDVIVEATDYGWFFDGPAEDHALIFYPGGKVEETAYAPFLHKIAREGMDVCLVKMPFHLAIFGKDRAKDVMREYTYENWYIGGHSLGGAMAADFAAGHEVNGIILCAAYPIKAVDESMLLLYGSEDGVLNMGRVAEAGQYGEVMTCVIPGGNHAQFGNYGVQDGDGAAEISAEEQQSEAVKAILAWIGQKEGVCG